MKRHLSIIIGIVIAAGIVIAVLFWIKNNTANPSIGAGGTNTAGSLPAVGTQGSNGSGATSTVATLGLAPTASSTGVSGQVTVQKFGVLSQSPVLDYFIDAKNNITAIQPTGGIITIINGQTATVNSSTIAGIISASFSYDGKKIVVSYGNPSDPHASLYDVATGAWAALPDGMLSPQWSPASNYQIAYLVATANGGKLALQTINAANLKAAPATLLTLNANDLTLQWPTANNFILADKPSSQNAGSIWVYNSSAETLYPLIYEIPGAEGIWSHDAAIPYGLTFFNNQAKQGNTLQLQAFAGGLPTQPLVFSTLPSKCVFNPELMPAATSTSSTTATSTAKTPSNKTATPTSTPYLALYCGIPRSSSGFSSAHLPDDYNMMALFTSDDIYKINTATGAEQVLWSDATQNMDVSDMKFFNNALFFVNRYDQKLYGLTFSSGN